MGKRSREQRRSYKRSRPEMLEYVRERFEWLIEHCATYDAHRFSAAKPLALDLRVLLHDTRASTSLLQQLGVKSRLHFEDTCGPEPAGRLLTTGVLAIPATTPGWGDWLPLYERRMPDPPDRVDRSPKPFEPWWTETIMVDKRGTEITRKRLVLWLCDQDGGAHVDPELDEDYAHLSRKNSTGWQVGPHPTQPGRDLESPVPASVRQIAHELVRSCQWWLSDVRRQST